MTDILNPDFIVFFLIGVLMIIFGFFGYKYKRTLNNWGGISKGSEAEIGGIFLIVLGIVLIIGAIARLFLM